MEESDAVTLDICLPYALHVMIGHGGFRAEWRTEDVTALATGILEDSAFERMPILADALEEAGCTDQSLLRHCRDPIPHDHQCWALGLALNRHPEPESSPTLEIELPRPIESRPRGGRAERSENGGVKDSGCVVVFCLWLLVKVLDGVVGGSGGGSTTPVTTPVHNRSVPVMHPAPKPPGLWGVPASGPKWEGLFDQQPSFKKEKLAYPWRRPSAPADAGAGGTR